MRHRVFNYYSATGRKPKGAVVGADIADARRRLALAGVRAARVEYALRETLNLAVNPRMTISQRAYFLRAASMRLRRSAAAKEAFAAAAASHELPVVLAAYEALDALNAGRGVSESLRRAGFPNDETEYIAAGETSGELAPTVKTLQDNMFMQIRIRKQIQSTLLMPAIAAVMLWVILFPAFALFMPHTYDTIIKPSNAADTLSPAILGIYTGALTLRGAMPLSAVVYYALPLLVAAAMRMSGITAVDVFSHFATIRRFFVAVDVLKAASILSQQIKFQKSLPDAAAAAGRAMSTQEMQTGLAEFGRNVRAGSAVTDAAHNSALPTAFATELVLASGANFAESMRDYGEIAADQVNELGKKMQAKVYVAVIAAVACCVLGLVLVTFIPTFKAVFLLAR